MPFYALFISLITIFILFKKTKGFCPNGSYPTTYMHSFPTATLIAVELLLLLTPIT